MSQVGFRVLGPVTVAGPGGPAELVGGRQRTLVGLLALAGGSVVSRDRLVDALWGEDPPRTALRTLHSHVSRVRQALEAAGLPDLLLTREPGYTLAIPRDCVDAHRFDAAVLRARTALDAGAWADAAAGLQEALGLWHGDALADGPPHGWAAAEVTRLHEMRLAAQEELWEARLRLGEHGQGVAELERLVAEHPSREGLARLLMLALYRSGRRADALERYHLLRERLADELGVDPDVRLQRLHTAILRGDPDLDLAAVAAPPPPEPIAVTPAQLPPPVGHFAGRAAHLDELDGWLAGPSGESRVVVICGPAGMGKTAFAAQWTRRIKESFPDGQLFLDLRGEDPDASLPPSEALAYVLRGLGVPADRVPQHVADQLGLYRSLIGPRRMLLVLDDAGTADHVLPLVPPTPTSLLVVTSRRRLAALAAYHEVRQVELDVLAPDEAMALLRGVLGPARVAAETAEAAQLARLCGGIPLALRLAAAKLAARPRQPIADLVAELSGDDRLDVLAIDGDTRSVRNVLATVHDSLSGSAAALFRLLGLHPGVTFSTHLSAALTGISHGRARRDLDELASAHLITEVHSGRYRMHDLIRIYAVEQAAETDAADRAAATTRILDWYLAIAHAANRILDPARDRVPAADTAFEPPFARTPDAVLAFLDREHANLVAVVVHAERHGHLAVTWQLSYLIAGYFESRGHAGDRVEIYRRGHAAAVRLGDRVAEGMMLSGLGVALITAHRHDEALDQLRAALVVMASTGDERGRGHVYNNIAATLGELRQFEAATEACEQALAVHTANNHRLGVLLALNNLGHLHARTGRLDLSLSCLEQGLALARQDGDVRLEGAIWHSMGETHGYRGDDEAAMACFGEALALRRTTGNLLYQSSTLHQIGTVQLRSGRTDEALATFAEEYQISRSTNDEHLQSIALADLGSARLAAGDPAGARADLRRALELRERIPDDYELGIVQQLIAELDRHDQAGSSSGSGSADF
ncbi:DNA-binding SARP family transcriptional activator/Tfp pilus assembly protein PilF [Allocatelliglobosispora scoriae]|uniref:DNA-binding SARP family transcriptional activator/Tfp pilus assembly protein PilF n=1 Tax=Allocatelliglobosispora scoriae TaxID=643052 RepID=A0A841BPL5_9ACTN|nr:BTAD domain-containing putative transcriptional regulator [Allocatelliglobosispora scoriae]MBB5868760.1 DNA-binding SARP family transcriptional activator/Tfp pilus assembly protein PilF [Allocatelliglobosispora scoriae]